ncbi:MAG: PUR family DNA/RNA-binding protein [Chitinophagales bacterium]|nr:PUR family DNA/RNA-binding protein [Chitinophagales bacterium]HRN95159.1 DUF3276 family protein [Chitinophagales bacterium]HRP39621.1 DUF3276 family protein [Chitinophagales bacterium]
MENKDGKYSGYFSKKLRAGKRRTYFFDVRSTKQGDFFLTITESKKKFDSDGYEMHKIFLYKEDFKKFMEALNETVDYIKSDLLPDYDFESERPSFAAKRENEEGAHEEENESYSQSADNSENSNDTHKELDEEDMTWN